MNPHDHRITYKPVPVSSKWMDWAHVIASLAVFALIGALLAWRA